MANVLTLEEELANQELAPSSSKFKLGRNQKQPSKKQIDIENNIGVETSNKKEDAKFKPKTNNRDRLTADATSILEYNLRKTPQYKIYDQQLILLTEELKQYKKSGDVEKIEACKNLIREVSAARKRIAQVFKSSNAKSNYSPEELKILYRNSPELQSMNKRQKELAQLIKENTPTWFAHEIRVYRKQLKLQEQAAGIAKESGSNSEVEDLDDYLMNDESQQEAEDFTEDIPADATLTELENSYFEFCEKVGNIIGETAMVVDSMKVNNILLALREALDPAKLEELKDESMKVKMQISQMRQKISGQVNIADVMFEIFDFDTEEKVPKEILAASSIPLVKSIAYNVVSKSGQLDDLDDAVSFGLLGLTVAINKWYECQKMIDSPLTFQGFADTYIVGSIRRGLLAMLPSGMSGSQYATMLTRQKQKIETFLKFNPEFKDFNREMVESLLMNFDPTNAPLMIDNESKISDIVGGEDGGESDIWANTIVDQSNSADSKIMYENLISSIKKLMNLFETETDKQTGVKRITKRKLFDKYDLRLFMMYFGLEYKVQKSDESKNGSLNAYYTQKEMGEELVEMYHADGRKAGKSDSFTSSAISTRISTMLNKIKLALDENPDLKLGFDYIRMNWEAHRSDMELLSNQREELGMKIERDDLREIYADDEEAMNVQLTDGKRLGDVFEISDTNPLEQEIGAIFDELYT